MSLYDAIIEHPFYAMLVMLIVALVVRVLADAAFHVLLIICVAGAAVLTGHMIHLPDGLLQGIMDELHAGIAWASTLLH